MVEEVAGWPRLLPTMHHGANLTSVGVHATRKYKCYLVTLRTLLSYQSKFITKLRYNRKRLHQSATTLRMYTEAHLVYRKVTSYNGLTINAAVS